MHKYENNIKPTNDIMSWADPEMGTGSQDPPPLENHKNIGFPSIIVLDPLKITKLLKEHSIVDHYRHASETVFRWRAYDGPLLAAFPSSHHPITKITKKNVVSVGPPLKLSGSAHACNYGMVTDTNIATLPVLCKFVLRLKKYLDSIFKN